ncbi:MAG: hypothetical protein HC773_24835 [Scytonema sp. CRU_2_7]|nr:hypothetical protein [Scytonema sp. CRU_2_7]
MFNGISAIDIVQVGSNTQFRLGDGTANNDGFGTGNLLLTLVDTSFTQANISTNISGTNIPTFQFS